MARKSPAHLVQRFIRDSRVPLSFEGREGYTGLDLNENTGLISSVLARKMGFADAKVLSRYPEYKKLHSRLAAYAGVSRENVQVVNGSDEAIPKLIRLFFKKGDTVVLPIPTFFTYGRMLALEGVRMVHVAHEEEAGELKLPVQNLLTAIRRKHVKGLIVSNPANPTGGVITPPEMLLLAEETSKRGIVFIVDEAYFEFYGKSSLSLQKRFQNIVILRTFSKVFGFAGLRVGYVIAHPSIIKELRKLILPWEVNHPGVRAALVAIEKHTQFLKAIPSLRNRGKRLESLLVRHGGTVFCTKTNFVLCRIRRSADIVRALKRKGVLVRYITAIDCIRIAIPGKDTYAKTLRILSTVFRTRSKKGRIP